MIIEESNATLKNFELVIYSGGPGLLISKTLIDVNEVNNDTGIIEMITKAISIKAIMVENFVAHLSATIRKILQNIQKGNIIPYTFLYQTCFCLKL